MECVDCAVYVTRSMKHAHIVNMFAISPSIVSHTEIDLLLAVRINAFIWHLAGLNQIFCFTIRMEMINQSVYLNEFISLDWKTTGYRKYELKGIWLKRK